MPDATSLCYCGRTKEWRAFMRRDGMIALSFASTAAEALDDCARLLGVEK
ncbi:hypothetical protein [Alcanivorax jadensis]|nr:hypothetical protein [Alcanivorax jadensis]|tara:strand:- start:2456 stop:2605 length:150 start_codon:yes stop_codon:yes gene_type:complete